MKFIRLNHDEVTIKNRDWVPVGGRLWAIWPSPIDVDQCFQEAGFNEFEDSDQDWDQDFATLLDRTIARLSEFGEPRLIAGENPESNRRSLRDALYAPAIDDRFPACLIQFGQPAAAIASTSWGHPLVWIWLADRDIHELLFHLAANLEIREVKLDWSHL